uniref:Protein archease-like protein n=1 Tax=Lygus hesperus TaxID=30085 RepID=A0A0A9XNX4_LYGHE
MRCNLTPLSFATDSFANMYYFDYHSHTADIQLHGHGATLGLALASVGVCMNNYMVELHSVGIDVDCTLHTTLRDTDLHRLTYRYLDSLLGYFLDDFIIFREIVMDVVYSSTTSMFTATCVVCIAVYFVCTCVHMYASTHVHIHTHSCTEKNSKWVNTYVEQKSKL